MPVVAVAGGTGGVGKTIVDVLTQEARHEIVVLTRKARENDAILNRAKQIEVDYSDIVSLTQILEEHKVNTVISALSLFEDEHSVSQLNLIKAAEDASSTRRFIPSEYSFIQTEDLLPLDPSMKYFLDAASQLRSSKTLQFTRVVPGFFMDYWGMPHVPTNIKPMAFGVDMQSCEAVIPGDGNDVICMTYTYDMAVFIARLLEVEHWEEFSVVVGDEVTFNQLVEVGERIRGFALLIQPGRKFKVVYDSVEKVKEGDVNVPRQPEGHGYNEEELVETMAFVGSLVIEKVFDFPAAIRSTGLSDLQLVKIEEFLRNAWAGRG